MIGLLMCCIVMQAQALNLTLRNVTVKQAIEALREKSDFTFVFETSDLNTQKRINLILKDASIEEAVEKIIEGQAVSYDIVEKNVIIRKEQKNANESANAHVVGCVVDEYGEPLIGVSILVKGTMLGTVTDLEGNFSIDAAKQTTLVFNYIGYELKEVAAKPNMNIIMTPSAIMINEVVSLGYTTAKKAELSSAAVTIKASELTDITTSDIGNMLQGKVAGITVSNASGQPGAASQIRVRGTGSITANADPLYVVDGIPGGTYSPNDVETITILKDAGATAIYGAAAAGGVVVVTTKSGKNQEGIKIDFKVTGGMKQPLFGNFKMMDSRELYYTHKDLYSKALFNTLRPKSLLAQDFNWQNEFFSNGMTQDYYVSVSGGSKKTNYFASVDYYNEDGTLINTGYERVAARLNLNSELAKGLNLNLRLAYNSSDTQETSSWTTLNDAYTKMPWDSPYNKNGEIEKITSSTREDGSTWYSQDKWNALHNEQYNYANNKAFGITADAVLSWQIVDWLNFTTTNRFSRDAWKYKQFIDPRTQSSEWDSGYLYDANGMGNSFGTTNVLKANYQDNQHSLSGMVGWEYGFWQTEQTIAAGTGMPNGMDALNATTPQTVGGSVTPGKSWSLFAQAQYDYAKRYFLTVSYRADASSMFGKDSRIGHFPSAAASWLMSNEDFLSDNDVVDMLKLRLSYGLTGNNNIPAYQYLSVYMLDVSYQNVVGATLARLANPELRWETAYMAAFGVDVSLFKERLNFSVDIYNTDNKDLLLAVPQAPSTGFFNAIQNRGSVRNQGIELQLNSVNIRNKHFRWDMGFNIGFNKNTVTHLPNNKPFLQTRNNITQEIKEGQDIYTWYMPKWMGVDPENGDPQWEKIIYDSQGVEVGREATNVYSEAQSQAVGKATPLFHGGFMNTLTYRGFSLAINTNFTVGNKIYNCNRMTLDSDGAYVGYNQMSMNNNRQGWSRWEDKGDQATHPKLVLNGNKQSNSISSRYLEDGSYFRIKNITLGYDFPVSIIGNSVVRKCRIYLSGDNLFTFTKFSGMDPEVTQQTSAYQLAGLYADNYPISRQLLLGVEIGF